MVLVESVQVLHFLAGSSGVTTSFLCFKCGSGWVIWGAHLLSAGSRFCFGWVTMRFWEVLAVLVRSSFTSFTAGALGDLLTPRPRQSGVLLTPRSPLDLRPWSVMDTRRDLAVQIASLRCFCGRLVASKTALLPTKITGTWSPPKGR